MSHLPEFRPVQSIFPAVTCPVQAAFRTGTTPSQNGLVANGLFFSDLRKVMFWEQSATLVEGPRIWDDFRARGKKVGMMFWQQSMGEAADLVVTPAPIHKHSGGMIQACYTQPASLEARLDGKNRTPVQPDELLGPARESQVLRLDRGRDVRRDGNAGRRARSCCSPTSRISTTISSATAP